VELGGKLMDAQAWDRITASYFEEISTPFQAEVVNPLLAYLDGLPGRQRMEIADLGCGIGNRLPFLSDRFKSVVAVDFSSKKLCTAQENCQRDNVQLCRQSLTDLSVFHGRFDLVVTVNSVLSPSLDVDQILREIAACLRPGGILAGIFPSMESVIYESGLIRDDERELSTNETEALQGAHRKSRRHRYDSVTGLYSDSEDRQRFYYSFELRHRLQKAGFKGLHFGKVLYPWYEEDGEVIFAGEPKLWDWFVRGTLTTAQPHEPKCE
jgi:SAM-dependent methyltransferase